MLHGRAGPAAGPGCRSSPWSPCFLTGLVLPSRAVLLGTAAVAVDPLAVPPVIVVFAGNRVAVGAATEVLAAVGAAGADRARLRGGANNTRS